MIVKKQVRLALAFKDEKQDIRDLPNHLTK